ncbi:MAG: hypothetical protein ACTH27_06685 [Staphylococcus equorum]
MAYEYERINNIGCVTSPISTDQAVEELQEVYHKAEILNKIANIIKTGRSLNSNIDFEIIVSAIEHELIYLEDK